MSSNLSKVIDAAVELARQTLLFVLGDKDSEKPTSNQTNSHEKPSES